MRLRIVIGIFVSLIILAAFVVGGLALLLPRDEIIRLIVFRDFFDVSLPILAFGALIKYLCTFNCGTKKNCACCQNKNCECCK
jgi:hypothetical protein